MRGGRGGAAGPRADALGLAGLLGGQLFGRIALQAIEGIRFSREEPHGAVPMTDGDHAALEAMQAARRRKRRLNILGATTIATEVGIVTVNAALSQVNFRRSPLRRRLNRLR